MTSSTKQKIILSAAPLGATPKWINPELPRAIDADILDTLVPKHERTEKHDTLKKAGWKFVEKGGIKLNVGNQAKFFDEDYKKLSNVEKIKAERWLKDHKWEQKIDTNGATYWQEPFETHNTLSIPYKLIDDIPNKMFKRQLVLKLTSQGWEANNDNAEFSWNLEKGVCFLTNIYAKKIQKLAPELYQHMMTQVGWKETGPVFFNTGSKRTPFLPIQPHHLLDEAKKAAFSGATIVHFHTRNLDQKDPYYVPGVGEFPNLIQPNEISPSQYNEIIPQFMDELPDVLVNLSTSARGNSSNIGEKRRAHLHKYGARSWVPDIGSFTPGSVIFTGNGGYDNPDDFVKKQLNHMKEEGIRPEVEVFGKNTVDHITGQYKDAIREVGTPPMFMLVSGVDMDKYWQTDLDENCKQEDNSLIPKEVKAEIYRLILSGNKANLELATNMCITALRPHVTAIREAHPDAIISTLMFGSMQQIIVPVAEKLGLDGVRLGLEDGLQVTDDKVPGGIRMATTTDQIVKVRDELISKGFSIYSGEELRDKVGLARPQVKIFREAEDALSPFTKGLPDTKTINVSEAKKSLAPLVQEYLARETQLIEDVINQIDETTLPEDVASAILKSADKFGLHNIRLFFEAGDRYEKPLNFPAKDIYTLQPLNFMREILHARGQDYSLFDKALEKFQPTENRAIKEPSKFIPKTQFKSDFLRCAEYLSFIPTKYNASKTNVWNLNLRQDQSYSATMSVLYTLIAEEMVKLFNKSSLVEDKKKGVLWYGFDLENHEITLNKEELAKKVSQGAWITLPSTPATNSTKGRKSGLGLARVFKKFISASVGKEQDVVLGVHSGRDENNEVMLEAKFLANRFALNTDKEGTLAGYSVKQLYDQLILPRLVKDSEKLSYNQDGMVNRNKVGQPLLSDGTAATRNDKTLDLPMLKFLGHSSGIAAMQQLDNLQRRDMTILGFSSEQQINLFKKNILFTLGSATGIDLSKSGTSVIDFTSSHDIRSIAGSSTVDYVDDISKRKRLDFIDNIQQERTNKNQWKKLISNESAPFKLSHGPKGKNLIRFHGVYLSDDPLRYHDGHTITNYTRQAPDTLKAAIKSVASSKEFADIDKVFYDMQKEERMKNTSLELAA